MTASRLVWVLVNAALYCTLLTGLIVTVRGRL